MGVAEIHGGPGDDYVDVAQCTGTGFHGNSGAAEACDVPCPGGEGAPCTDHGDCDDGLFGSGTCTCDEGAGWAGAACNATCAPPRVERVSGCADDDDFAALDCPTEGGLVLTVNVTRQDLGALTVTVGGAACLPVEDCAPIQDGMSCDKWITLSDHEFTCGSLERQGYTCAGCECPTTPQPTRSPSPPTASVDDDEPTPTGYPTIHPTSSAPTAADLDGGEAAEITSGAAALVFPAPAKVVLRCTLPEGTGAEQEVLVASSACQYTRPSHALSFAPPSVTNVSGCEDGAAGSTFSCPPEGNSFPHGVRLLTLDGTNFGRRGAVVLIGGATCHRTSSSFL
jgi:hypothetical protein